MKNRTKLKNTLQKIIVVVSVVAVLCASLVIPISASILPSEGATYSNSNSDVAKWNYSVYGSVYEGDTDYEIEGLLSDNVGLQQIGTNDFFNVAKPIGYQNIGANDFTMMSHYITVPIEMFANSDNPHKNIGAYYRLRFGFYMRAKGNNSKSMNFDVSAMVSCANTSGAMVYGPKGASGTYIYTDTRGSYYYFDLSVYYDGTVDFVDLVITVEPAEGDDYFTFDGAEPQYKNSFVAFTAFYVESHQNELTNEPFSVGTIVPYGEKYLILGDSTYVTADNIVNPFTNQKYEYYWNDAVFVSNTYPLIAYYYVNDITAGTTGGYIYQSYVVTAEIVNNMIPNVDYEQLYLNGYSDGKESIERYYQSIVEGYERQISTIIENQKDENKLTYNRGYSDGYSKANLDVTTFKTTVNSLGDLLRKVIHGIGDFGFYGVTVQALIVTAVIVFVVVFVLKKVK